MTAQIINGTAFAAQILARIKRDAAKLESDGTRPHLVAVQVGENSASRAYIAEQKKSAGEAGINYTVHELSAESATGDVVEHVKTLNADPDVHGIILQMPMPEGVNQGEILRTMTPEKDAEGMTRQNLGRLFHSSGGPAPCTAAAALELARSTGIPLQGKYAVVVGHSEIVGKPLSAMLLSENATLTTCHIFTPDISRFTREADFLFVATGAAQFRWAEYKKKLAAFEKGEREKPALPDLSALITRDMIKPGAVVIDIGVNRVPKGFDENGEPVRRENGRIAMTTIGDVDFEAAMEVASHVTPARGGVGPVTVAMLLRNVVDATRSQNPA